MVLQELVEMSSLWHCMVRSASEEMQGAASVHVRVVLVMLGH